MKEKQWITIVRGVQNGSGVILTPELAAIGAITTIEHISPIL